MVAASETKIKTMATGGKKVSKPLMEKKRRARINTCLEQLKTLLESFYSSNIRKRKLEKADILELTVRHLKQIQKTEKGFNAGFADYHAGFRSCLAGVNQYLLLTDVNPPCRSSTLAHLSNGLLRLGTRLPDSSTADSDGSKPHARASLVTSTSCTGTFMKVSQNSERAHNIALNRTDFCQKEQTAKVQHKDVQFDSVPTVIDQNYWRPW